MKGLSSKTKKAPEAETRVSLEPMTGYYDCDNDIRLNQAFIQNNRVMVRGVSGTGKSALVRHYAHQVFPEQGKTNFVAEMAADSTDKFYESLHDLAGKLYDSTEVTRGESHDKVRTLVLDKLSELAETNWKGLLIFDNVTSEEVSTLIELLVQKKIENVFCLVTTNNPDIIINKFDTLNILGWQEEESIAFLRKNLPTISLENAARIASKMGYLPLGLNLACSYLISTEVSPDKLLRILSEEETLVLIDHDEEQSLQSIFPNIAALKAQIAMSNLIKEIEVSNTPQEGLAASDSFSPPLSRTTSSSEVLKKNNDEELSSASTMPVDFSLISDSQISERSTNLASQLSEDTELALKKGTSNSVQTSGLGTEQELWTNKTGVENKKRSTADTIQEQSFAAQEESRKKSRQDKFSVQRP